MGWGDAGFKPGILRHQSGALTTNPSQLLTARNLQNIVKTSDFRNLLMWAPSGFRRGLYFGPKTIFIPPPPLSENDNFSPLESRDTIICEPYRALCLDFSLSCIYLTLILLPIFSFKPLSSFSFLLSSFFFNIFFFFLPFLIFSPPHMTLADIFPYLGPWAIENCFKTALVAFFILKTDQNEA
jgi:hypothetical protein